MQHAPFVTRSKLGNKREVRYPGICNDAEVLGVTRQHLRLVLSGKRQSKKLSRAYQRLRKEKQSMAEVNE